MQGEFRGDFTRDTYDKSKHFLRVLMQQGRVQLDADFNEQISILLNRLQTLAKDVFGVQGGPEQNCGFEFIATEKQINNINNLNDEEKQKLKQLLKSQSYLISKGNYYVDGILCENEEFISYFQQPDFKPELLEPCQVQLKGATYLAYLDVWERHITPIEDYDDRKINIREVALGGADTATRSKLVWQVKLKQLKDDKDIETVAKQITKDCNYFYSLLGRELMKPGEGKIIARVTKPSSTPMNDPCVIPFYSKFRGTENHLYRAEIFTVPSVSKNNQLSFVWSRENSSIVFPIVTSAESNSSAIAFTLEHLGKDKDSSLSAGDWVEIIDDDYVLGNSDRQLIKVEQVDCIQNQVILSGDAKNKTLLPEKHPLLRRWDSKEIKVNLSEVNNKWFPLEDGIEIQFQADTQNNFYQVGDYWLIPVRIATGNVEWPQQKNKEGKLEPQPQSPHGIAHYYAPLAVFLGNPDNITVHDCRRKIVSQDSNITPVSNKDNNTLPANTQVNPVPPINQEKNATQTITEFNRIINASWHHDQVLEATLTEAQENSNIPEDELFNLKSQVLRNLFTKLGLVIQFEKPVRIDSLHKTSVSVLAHTDNVLKGEVFYILPMKVEPVQVKKTEIKSIRWAIGNEILDTNVNLITEVEPLSNGNSSYTEAVRLITPNDWSQKAVFNQNNIYQFTVLLHGDWIINEEPLFDNANLNLLGDLNKSIIPDELYQQFQDKGITLSQNIILVTEKENFKWRLVDGGKTYIIKIENNKLTASKTQALDGNNIWPGVPERFSGNGSEGGDWVSIIHIKT